MSNPIFGTKPYNDDKPSQFKRGKAGREADHVTRVLNIVQYIRLLSTAMAANDGTDTVAELIEKLDGVVNKLSRNEVIEKSVRPVTGQLLSDLAPACLNLSEDEWPDLMGILSDLQADFKTDQAELLLISYPSSRLIATTLIAAKYCQLLDGSLFNIKRLAEILASETLSYCDKTSKEIIAVSGEPETLLNDLTVNLAHFISNALPSVATVISNEGENVSFAEISEQEVLAGYKEWMKLQTDLLCSVATSSTVIDASKATIL